MTDSRTLLFINPGLDPIMGLSSGLSRNDLSSTAVYSLIKITSNS